MSGRIPSVLAEMRHVGKHMWGQLEKGLKRQGVMGLGAMYILSFHYNFSRAGVTAYVTACVTACDRARK